MAIRYAKNGERQAAYETLISALRRDHRDARAWAVVATVVDDVEIACECLQCVLDLSQDPQLIRWAKEGLDKVRQS